MRPKRNEVHSALAMAAVDARKRRRYQRIGLPKGMMVAWQSSDQRIVSRVGTLGLGGLFICTNRPPPVGTPLRLLFELPGGEVRARAIVRDSVPGTGMGVEFTSMAYEGRARLQQLLKRLLRDPVD